MATLGPLDQILNNTPADAVQVNGNFQEIETFVNTEVIQRDGSVAMTGNLVLTGTATDPNHAVSLGELSSSISPGIIVEFGGPNVPNGWLACDGSVVEQVDYPALYSVVTGGTNTGPGIWWDGTTPVGGTQFQLPDHRQRVGVGVGDVGSGWETVGATGGSADVVVGEHQHSLSSGGEHTHAINHNHTATVDAVLTHDHSINHDHPAVTSGTESSTHYHAMSRSGVSYGTDGAGATGTTKTILSNDGAAFGVFNTGNDVGNHTHSVNLPNFSGTSGDTDISHDHAISDFTGTSGTGGPANTDDFGEDPTGKNYPPYYIATKMIKA